MKPEECCQSDAEGTFSSDQRRMSKSKHIRRFADLDASSEIFYLRHLGFFGQWKIRSKDVLLQDWELVPSATMSALGVCGSSARTLT